MSFTDPSDSCKSIISNLGNLQTSTEPNTHPTFPIHIRVCSQLPTPDSKHHPHSQRKRKSLHTISPSSSQLPSPRPYRKQRHIQMPQHENKSLNGPRFPLITTHPVRRTTHNGRRRPRCTGDGHGGHGSDILSPHNTLAISSRTKQHPSAKLTIPKCKFDVRARSNPSPPPPKPKTK